MAFPKGKYTWNKHGIVFENEVDRKLFKAYGIRLNDYRLMVAQQNGRCAICGRPPSGAKPSNGRLQVDHDHESGTLRGLLCGNCNTALGLLQDDPTMIYRALRYLAGER